MTGIIVSKSHYQNSKTLSLSSSLENRAAKVFQQRSWLNDLSLPLLLMLAGSLASRPAHAQQETPLNDIAVTAQNQFGTASQLLIKDGVLYLIEDGCNLVMIRKLSDEDIAAIRALSTLSADKVGLHLQIVSYAPITVSELSEFCVASDPMPAFINRIREDDGDSSSIAGFLDGGADSVRDKLTGGAGKDIFIASADDDTDLAGADLVTDFASGDDKIQISLSQDDIRIINDIETGKADKLIKLLELANLEVTNNADAGHSSTDKSDNDTVLTNKGANKALGGGDDTLLMILEDYSTDLTFDNFSLDVL